MLLLLHIIVAYIKENIITKLQKFYSPHRSPREGNKSPTLFVKQPLCTGDLSPACEIFIERLEEDSECLCFESCLWSHHSAKPRVSRRKKCFIKYINIIDLNHHQKNWVDWISARQKIFCNIKNLHFEKESPRFWKTYISWLLFIFLVLKSVEVLGGLRPF